MSSIFHASPSSSPIPIEKRRDPKCSLCVNHLGQAAPRTLGHKNLCPYTNCKCEKCAVTLSRREGTAVEQQQRRNPGKSIKNVNHLATRKSFDRTDFIIAAVKKKFEAIISKIDLIHQKDEMVIKELESLLNTVEEGLNEDFKPIQVQETTSQMPQNFDKTQSYINFPTTISTYHSPSYSNSSGSCSYVSSTTSFNNQYDETYEVPSTLNATGQFNYYFYQPEF